MSYLFTSESVADGHPDKVADRIADALLDEYLAFDSASRVACEVLVTTGQVVVAGEVCSRACVDVQDVVRRTIREIGYTRSEYGFDAAGCGVLSALHEQSVEIRRGVERGDVMEQGAGDQGMMFGYATNETRAYIPLGLYLCHTVMRVLGEIRRGGREMRYLRPDGKCQVTVEYSDEGVPLRVHTVVLSVQHDAFVLPSEGCSAGEADEAMLGVIRRDVREVLLPRVWAEIGDERVSGLFDARTVYHVNPTGRFVIGGPHGDTGLTGRKIVVDTYGGACAHGGGAFSGKDSSKVDRSGAYAARYIAKNMVAAGVSDRMLVQVSYAIGVARPVSVYVNTFGTSHVGVSDGEIAVRVGEMFDLRPRAIEERLGLRNPIYEETAAYGHVGREPRRVVKVFRNRYLPERRVEVELFTWERLDCVDLIRKKFGLV